MKEFEIVIDESTDLGVESIVLTDVPIVEFEQIEDLLFPVRTEITLGQWKTALKKLQEINPISIGEDLYSKIETTISDYILQHY